MRARKISVCIILFMVFASFSVCAGEGERYIRAVQQYGDLVLGSGHGFSEKPTLNLFADGLNFYTGEPVKIITNATEYLPSNLANQQLLMRTLAALTDLTGDEKYKDAAKERIQYYFDNFTDVNGLLRWGGHRFVNLRNEKIAGEQSEHELKAVYPYYDLMYETDPEATLNFIKAYWNTGVTDWGNLAVNRHGKYGAPMGDLWNSTYTGDGNPHFLVEGLPFFSSGSDMMFAAAKYIEYTGDTSPRPWIDRLQTLFAATRNPITKLGGQQYGILSKGDRAAIQFGADFGEKALEMNYLNAAGIRGYYGENILGLLEIAKVLDDDGLVKYVAEGMEAFFGYAYDAENYRVYSMFTDGERVHDYTFKVGGYYGDAGSKPTQSAPGTKVNYSSVVAAVNSDSEELWQAARAINIRYNFLGDIGGRDGSGIKLRNITTSEPIAAFIALELYEYSKNEVFLNAAKDVANNILRDRFENGMFITKSAGNTNMKLETHEAIALLRVAAAIEGIEVPALDFYAGGGYIHGTFDGYGRNYDNSTIYQMKDEFPQNYSRIISLDNFSGYLRDTGIDGHGGFTQLSGSSAEVVFTPREEPNVNQLSLKMPAGAKLNLDLRVPSPLNCQGNLVVEFEVWQNNAGAVSVGVLDKTAKIENAVSEEFVKVRLVLDKQTGTLSHAGNNTKLNFEDNSWIENICFSAHVETYMDNLKIYEENTSSNQPEFLADINFEEGFYTDDNEGGAYLFSSAYGTPYGESTLTPTSVNYVQGGTLPLKIERDVIGGGNNALRFETGVVQGIDLDLPHEINLEGAGDDLVVEYDYYSTGTNGRLVVSFMDNENNAIYTARYQATDLYFRSETVGAGGRDVAYNYVQYKNNVNSGFQTAKFVFKRATQTVDLYIDGVLRMIDVKNTTMHDTIIKKVRIAQNHSSNRSDTYIDNIRVYTQSPTDTSGDARVARPRYYQSGEYSDIYSFRHYHANIYNARFTIKLPDASEQTPREILVIQAQYDAEDNLTGMSLSKHKITSADVQYIENEYTADSSPIPGDKLKTLIWDFGTLKPLYAPWTIYR